MTKEQSIFRHGVEHKRRPNYKLAVLVDSKGRYVRVPQELSNTDFGHKLTINYGKTAKETTRDDATIFYLSDNPSKNRAQLVVKNLKKSGLEFENLTFPFSYELI